MEKLKAFLDTLLEKPALHTEAVAIRNLLEKFAIQHSWTQEEKDLLYQLYTGWVSQHGALKRGDIKNFLNEIRPQFTSIEDEHFYDTVRRQLYRVLVEHDVSWPGRGKRTLKETLSDTKLVGYLQALEALGYLLYEDGSIWYVNPPIVYDLHSLDHAIEHERKVAMKAPTTERQRDAQEALKLLEAFRTAWIKTKSKVFNPKSFLGEGYTVTPMAGGLYEIKTPQGNTYTVDKEKNTCTCPAGQKGSMCKHIREITYHY